MTSRAASSLGERALERIGNTPLLRLERIAADFPGIQILAKAEWHNPGGSVKDRAALAIVQKAEREGLLASGKSLLDATSGNTGIAYAMIGAARQGRFQPCQCLSRTDCTLPPSTTLSNCRTI